MLKVKDQSAQAQPKKYYTAEEYLALEEKAEYKSEYYKGEIFAMAGGMADHGRIVRNMTTKLTNAFGNKNCEAFSNEMRIRIDAAELFTYPDVVVFCGGLKYYKDRHDTATNPLLIIEVLSKSTQSYDRNEKFRFYQSIPSLREYLMIDQHKIHLEQFSLGKDGKWALTEYKNTDDILRCTSVDFQIPLREIYDRVEFENE
jgi:Uma2 family endonuclease